MSCGIAHSDRCWVCWGTKDRLGYCPNAGRAGHTEQEIMQALREEAVCLVIDYREDQRGVRRSD